MSQKIYKSALKQTSVPGEGRKSSKNEKLPEPRFYRANRTSNKFNQRTKGSFCYLFA